MTEAKKIPTFNMKVVVQETGIKHDTLRAWERRYGVPAPERTAGGHRLYSQHEIDLLKWLMMRQDEGFTIGNAIEMFRQFEADGQNPFEIFPIEKEVEDDTLVDGNSITSLRNQWIKACLNFDEYTAQHTVAQAFAQFPMETVCFQVLQKGLTEIGIGWYEGKITVQQEHFASSLAIRQLEALMSAMPTPRQPARILIACPPKEQHTFSPLMLALMFRKKGWEVIYLGANVPSERLASSLALIKPDLVVLTAQTLFTAGMMLEMAQIVQQSNIPLAYGGAVFNFIPATRDFMPGHFLGESLPDAPKLVDDFLKDGLKKKSADKSANTAYQTAVKLFEIKRSAINAHVRERINIEHISPVELNNANIDFGNNIFAALILGDMHLMNTNIDWVEGILMNYHYRMPHDAMNQFVATYYDGVNTHMGADAAPLIEWFDTLLKTLG